MTILFLFIFGLFIGSFLNVLSDRLPKGENVIIGRSHCDHCKHYLGWKDLVPLFSFIYLQGKCRYCKKHVSWFYPVSELITAIVFVITYSLLRMYSSQLGMSQLVYYLFIVSGLLVIFFSDLKYRIIPDKIIILLAGWILLWMLINGMAINKIINYSLAGITASLAFLAIILITNGRGMGFGDVKYAFVMGLLLGLPYIILGLYLAFLTGGIVSLILVLARHSSIKSKIPFGPFLVFATFIMLFDSVGCWQFFMKLLGL